VSNEAKYLSQHGLATKSRKAFSFNLIAHNHSAATTDVETNGL